MCEQFNKNQSFSLFFKLFCDLYWAIHLIQCCNRSGRFLELSEYMVNLNKGWFVYQKKKIEEGGHAVILQITDSTLFLWENMVRDEMNAHPG